MKFADEIGNSILLIKKDGLDFSFLEKLNESVWSKMNGRLETETFFNLVPNFFKRLKEVSNVSEQKEACKSFANYIWHKSR